MYFFPDFVLNDEAQYSYFIKICLHFSQHLRFRNGRILTIDNVGHPDIFGDHMTAKMPKVKAIAVWPYPYSNRTTFQR